MAVEHVVEVLPDETEPEPGEHVQTGCGKSLVFARHTNEESMQAQACKRCSGIMGATEGNFVSVIEYESAA